MATGGSVHPLWPGPRPQWLPPAFDWVVGCSYLGLPEKTGAVRNPIGANMSMRTRPALDAGGFDTGLGRVGTRPVGCEETELAIRLTPITSIPTAITKSFSACWPTFRRTGYQRWWYGTRTG